MDETWYSSFAMGSANDMFFMMVIEKGITAMIKDPTIELGAFYEIKIAPNQFAEKSFKAKHLVTQFRPMEPLATVRVDHDIRTVSPSAPQVILTTKALFDGYVADGKYMRLFNEQFGSFIDLGHLVKHTDKMVEFEFKCKISPADRTRSIFVPVNIIRYSDVPVQLRPPMLAPHADNRLNSHRYRRLEGFVGSARKTGTTRFVWSRDLPSVDALMEAEFFPPGVDIAGKWVEMVIDEKLFVVETVRVIPDFYPTRVVAQIPEILVTFEYDGFYERGNTHMFFNSYFGLIYDKEGMVGIPEHGVSYSGWIMRNRLPGVDSCRFKISAKQPPISKNSRPLSPERNRSNDQWNDQRRPGSRGDHNRRDTRDRSLSPPNARAFHSGYENSERALSRGDHSGTVQENNEKYYRSRSSSPEERPPSRAPSSTYEPEPDRALSPAQSDVSPARRRVVHNYNYYPDSSSSSESSTGLQKEDNNHAAPGTSRHGTSSGSQSAAAQSSRATASGSENELERLRNKMKTMSRLVTLFTDIPEIRKAMKMLDLEHYDEMLELANVNQF